MNSAFVCDLFYQMTYGHPGIKTPFGLKYIINADTTASGYPNRQIESIINNQILVYYNNTHSNAYCGRLMTQYIEQSKEIIRQSLNAQKRDQIIFTGNGCSGAINHLIHSLSLRNTNKNITIIFLTKAEHHSNHLPWTHLPVTLIYVPLLKNGLIDHLFLEQQLVKHKNFRAIIASFNASSNVTGVHQNVHQISQLIHNYGGLIFWDYAASAPYIPINIHHNDHKGQYFDAIFISAHKFFGGPGAPGILVAHQNLFKNNVPYCPAGGTVRFVCSSFKTYISDIETKETGGTPNIIGCIKAGLAFDLKNKYQNYIIKKDAELLQYVQSRLLKIPNLKLLNPINNLHRLPIFVFLIDGLHYNFIVALLNDLFGIQTRGGISCCSLLAQELLQIDAHKQKKISDQILNNQGTPGYYGWCRVSFHYAMPYFIVEYITNAIQFISQYGHLFLKYYKYYPQKNHWLYCSQNVPWEDFNHIQLSINQLPTKNPIIYLDQSILSKQFFEAHNLLNLLHIQSNQLTLNNFSNHMQSQSINTTQTIV